MSYSKVGTLAKYNNNGKKAVVLAKGPTLDKYSFCDDDVIFSLNTSGFHLQKIDFLVMNDIEALSKIKQIEKTKNIILPIQLHQKSAASRYTFLDVLQAVKDKDIMLYTYRLHTQNIPNPITDFKFDSQGFPYPVWSTLQTALNWIILSGFKRVDIYGVSQTSQYNKKFVETNDIGEKRSEHWYQRNYMLAVSMLQKEKIDYRIY
jgi:hypothetical protein